MTINLSIEDQEYLKEVKIYSREMSYRGIALALDEIIYSDIPDKDRTLKFLDDSIKISYEFPVGNRLREILIRIYLQVSDKKTVM